MKVKTIKITNEDGLHGRPAAQLMAFAKTSECKIELHYKGKMANAKSLLEILSLGISKNDEVTFYCTGPDAEKTLEEIERRLINDIKKDKELKTSSR